MITIILLFNTNSEGITSSYEYIIGILISVFIFGYLVYSLIKPKKF